MWEFLLFFFLLLGSSKSGKRTVFTVIYVHFGMCTSHGVTLSIFSSCQKTVECDTVKTIEQKKH